MESGISATVSDEPVDKVIMVDVVEFNALRIRELWKSKVLLIVI